MIEWHWIGDHAKVPERERVAAILNPRWSDSKVREIVEILYAAREAGHSSQLRYAHRPSSNPYRAQRGHPIAGKPAVMTCGHNPFLMAGRADGVRPVETEDGERLEYTWRTWSAQAEANWKLMQSVPSGSIGDDE